MNRYLADTLGPPTVERAQIPRGYAGTRRTVHHVARLIREGAKDFFVRQRAIDILLRAATRPKDHGGEIKSLFEWVQRNVRYTRDPFRVEVLHSARRMLDLRAGDCDDMTILLGAMLESIGHPVRIVIVGPTPLQPRLFSHIYLEAWCRGLWISLDPTMSHPMGWAPRGLVKQVIAIQRRAPMPSDATGLHGLGPEPAAWLTELLHAVEGQALPAKDRRIKSLWDLLRERGVLYRSAWLRQVLRKMWARGLQAKPRPKTAARIKTLLQEWGVLPASVSGTEAGPSAQDSVVVHKLRPVVVRPLRRVHVRRVPPAQVPASYARQMVRPGAFRRR